MQTSSQAQKALVLAPATLTYAVAGKSVVSGVTASAAKVTVTVDGKTYTATADDVTGAFTVATSGSQDNKHNQG